MNLKSRPAKVLHGLWQVSLGCWVTWSISSWQEYNKSVFFFNFTKIQFLNDKIYSLQFAVHGLQSKEEFLISTPTSLLGMYCIGSFHWCFRALLLLPFLVGVSQGKAQCRICHTFSSKEICNYLFISQTLVNLELEWHVIGELC